jgi:methanogenic corrinoid protein MtbC1
VVRLTLSADPGYNSVEMSTNGRFVAQILETSAVGYAGLSASLLLERHPEIGERYDSDGFANWKTQLQRWLLDLSAAIDAGEPELFESRMLWTRKAFIARQASVSDLQAALEALRDVLRERLPEGSTGTVIPAIDRALEAVADPGAKQAGALDPEEPAGRSALSYLETILEGKPREATEQLLAAVDGGTSVKEAYLDVLIPAQREAGRMWHAGELSIGEEHVITATTQRAMANVHDMGLRATSDFFEMAGWRALNLGSDVPHEEIARCVQTFDADVVVLAATLDPHLKGVQRAIEKIRALEDREVKIIVGGPVFKSVPDLWRRVGADGYSAAVEEAEPLATRLTGS